MSAFNFNHCWSESSDTFGPTVKFLIVFSSTFLNPLIVVSFVAEWYFSLPFSIVRQYCKCNSPVISFALTLMVSTYIISAPYAFSNSSGNFASVGATLIFLL